MRTFALNYNKTLNFTFMKTKKIFFILAVAVPFLFISCNRDEGKATITFDVPNPFEIEKGKDFVITGTIRSNEGTTISSIIAMVEWSCDGHHHGHHGHHTHTRIIARSGDDVFTRNSSYEYSFGFGKDHAGMTEGLRQFLGSPDLKLIIKASVRNGGESSEKLAIIVKDEECGCGHDH